MTKKLFTISVGYGQFVVVAESKEEAYKLFHPEDKEEEHYYSYYRVEMEDIHEVEGYKVEGETSVIGGYAELPPIMIKMTVYIGQGSAFAYSFLKY